MEVLVSRSFRAADATPREARGVDWSTSGGDDQATPDADAPMITDDDSATSVDADARMMIDCGDPATSDDVDAPMIPNGGQDMSDPSPQGQHR